MRVAAHHHVDLRQPAHQRQVVLQAEVRCQHDVAHTLRTQRRHGLGRGVHFLQEDGAGQRLRRSERLALDRQPDDAHAHAANGAHHVWLQQGRPAPGRQRGAGCRPHVGRQHRRAAAAVGAQGVEEAAQRRIAFVELMVAERERVEAAEVHHLRIGRAAEHRMEQRAGERVAGMDLQQRPAVVQLPHCGHHARHAAEFHPREQALHREVEAALRLEVRMVVVDVDDAQLEWLGRGQRRASREQREQGGDDRPGQAAQQGAGKKVGHGRAPSSGSGGAARLMQAASISASVSFPSLMERFLRS
ncbi:hypothetical protein LRS14_13955 [Aquincola sp. J276]|nr:hypothetical protein [Aquincola sp. J276]MCR5866308.1 hypothetical protein [Aquincola sp. J276]